MFIAVLGICVAITGWILKSDSMLKLGIAIILLDTVYELSNINDNLVKLQHPSRIP